ncbi:MAG: TIM barrel protein [Methanobacterium sp.]|nr:TIM barrel protein [Methanobacterium sp.]
MDNMPQVRFGPAGRPMRYSGVTELACDYIREIGLDAYEYQATYGVKIKKQSGLRLKENSRKNDVLLSMHAPYYINLSSNKDDVVERSIDRLLQSARAAEWIGAYRIVFHPGFYTKYSPNEAMKRCQNSIDVLKEQLSSKGINDYTFAPETTGKKSQLGNLEEIIKICQNNDNFAPTVDFAHLYARSVGEIKDQDDYSRIFSKLEDELGLKTLHSHFTRIEYTDKGEKKHHALMEKNYGPPLEPLLKEIVERGWDVTMICETPFRDEDALLIQEEYRNILN